jgi:TrmH family RNA methyltransferase
MLSKQQITFVRSLHQKKYRQMYGKFLVEGDKLVRELLASGFPVDAIYALASWQLPAGPIKSEHIIVNESELGRISTHESPNQVVAVAPIPETVFNYAPLEHGLYLALDQLQDPGNAGTIIRIADWFGISHVFFSEGSVDIFNPKVVSAAKGSLFRVKCRYADLKKLFEASNDKPVYGAFMEGENIYQAELGKTGFILIGNEANGISEALSKQVSAKISIPAYGNAESLNAAVAAGIIISEFRRRSA